MIIFNYPFERKLLRAFPLLYDDFQLPFRAKIAGGVFLFPMIIMNDPFERNLLGAFSLLYDDFQLHFRAKIAGGVSLIV